LDEQRVNGSVIPLQDLIKDAYDNVVHFSDYKGQKTDLNEAGPARRAQEIETGEITEHKGIEVYAGDDRQSVPAD